MYDKMTVRIAVVGNVDDEAIDLLLFWLQSERKLSPHVVLRRVNRESQESGSPVSTLTIYLRAARMAAFVAVMLARWLQGRSGIMLRLSVRDGQTVELPGDTTAEDAGRSLETLAVSSGIVAPGWGHISHMSRVAAEIGGERGLDWLRPLEDNRWNPSYSVEADGSILPVTIYLSEAGIHEQVEEAIDDLLATAGLRIVERDKPVKGSWFRRMRAGIGHVTRSSGAREAALVAVHAADTRLVLVQDAAVTATLLQNLGPVITSLQPTKDAVLRVGALLIVKAEWIVNVFQLTAVQQAMLDHNPQLASSPHEIIVALNLTCTSEDADRPTLQ